MRILFVCTGNTCRSPMAEALARREAERRRMPGVEFESAGLQANSGSRATRQAADAMAARGLDIDRRPARQVTAQMVREADAVLAMTRAQAEALMDRFPQQCAKIHTLGGFAGVPGDVADPWGGDDADYERAARQLEGLVQRILDLVR